MIGKITCVLLEKIPAAMWFKSYIDLTYLGLRHFERMISELFSLIIICGM